MNYQTHILFHVLGLNLLCMATIAIILKTFDQWNN